MHLGNCKANGHEDRFVHQNRRELRFTNSFSLNKKGLSFDVSKVKYFDPQQQDIWHAYLGYAANFQTIMYIIQFANNSIECIYRH